MTDSQKFSLTAYRGGRRQRLTVTARSLTQAIMQARRKGYQSVRPARMLLARPRSVAGSGRIAAKIIMIFTRKLASMLGAGLPVIDALEILHQQADGKVMQAVLADICSQVKSGTSLAQAFGCYARHFNSLYRHMIEAGEASGKLDMFLLRLADYLEAQHKIRSAITSALFYPLTLLVITIGISVFMLISVVPVFAEIFISLGAELPAPTQFLLNLSEWLGQPVHLVGMLLSGAVAFGTERLLRLLPAYRYMWSWLGLRLPVFRTLILKSQIARLCHLLSNLIEAGVALPECLHIASSGSQNLVISAALGRIADTILSGRSLSELFSQETVFPDELSQLIAVGERTGTTEDMLDALARYYSEEVDTLLTGLTTIIEPVMIVVIGIVIGGLVLALYLPIFSAGSVLSGQ